MKELISFVPGHTGPCKPTWLNHNFVCTVVDGGMTGFFRRTRKVRWWPWRIRYGEEFHGIIHDGRVYSTTEQPHESSGGEE